MDNHIATVEEYFGHLSRTAQRIPLEMVEQIAEVLLRAYEENQAIYLFGNGGSAALASHFACDLGKGTVNGSPRRFRVLGLTDNVPLMTAWANDAAYEDIFAEQLANFVQPRDVAFAISGSGNSPNVLAGLRRARAAGATTVGLTGFEGGRMKPLCDICLVIPCANMQIIEDLHLSVTHSLFTIIRQKLLEAAEMAMA